MLVLFIFLFTLAIGSPTLAQNEDAVTAEQIKQMHRVMEQLVKLAKDRNVTLDHEKLMKEFQKRQIFVPPDIAREMRMSATEMITYRGYPAEEHKVNTEDKYINTMQRIPHGRYGPNHNPAGFPRPVAFLQHGLLDSSYTWINNLAHQSLGYILADAGFDVWLGNMRGNRHSRAHEVHDPDDGEKYWRFSFDQIAKYDLPAAFNYITKKTGKNQVFYVGHSLGTTIAFAGFSSYPELAAKVKVFVGLAPVAKVGNIRGLFSWMAPFADLIAEVYSWIGGGEFVGNHWIFKLLADLFCNEVMSGVACENVLYLIMGYDDKNINRTRLPIYTTHAPAGTSVQNVRHLAQNVNSGKFKMFDYGGDKNSQIYGSRTPPDYNLGNFKTKTALYWSKIDWLAQPPDVNWLLDQLNGNGHNPLLYATHVDTYTHLDFVWGQNANDKIYHHIAKLFLDNL